MSFEHKPGSGTIFIVPKAERKPNSPFAKGQIKTLDGKLCDVALWYATDRNTGAVKKDKNGNEMFSVKLSEPYRKEGLGSSEPDYNTPPSF